MRLKDWLKGESGRGSALARYLGVSCAMVSYMGSEQVRVPPRHYRGIRDFSGGAVSIEELLPDVHGPSRRRRNRRSDSISLTTRTNSSAT
jgi:DNA-binding transcriptional regulator YdaS (Cro superfamily)